MLWSRVIPFEKNPWSRAPIMFPLRSSGAQFPLCYGLNLPIASSKGPKRSIAPSRAQFPVAPSGHLAPNVPIALLRVSNFPHCVIKGPQIFHCVMKGPQFPHFPSRYQGVSVYHCVIKGPPFSRLRHQRDQNFQNTPCL